MQQKERAIAIGEGAIAIGEGLLQLGQGVIVTGKRAIAMGRGYAIEGGATQWEGGDCKEGEAIAMEEGLLQYEEHSTLRSISSSMGRQKGVFFAQEEKAPWSW